jgi:5-dehydro-2-deoxygluconokinase
VVTGTALAADPSRGAAFRAIERALAAGLVTVFDIDHRPYGWASAAEAAGMCGRGAGLCDIVIGNDAEFGLLAGAADRGLSRARAMAAARGGIAIYKMGPRGAVTFAGGRELRTGVFATQPLKPTGAGDAFLGAFLAALAGGRDIEDAVLRGSAAAAIVVGRVGCAPAMPDEGELAVVLAREAGPAS